MSIVSSFNKISDLVILIVFFSHLPLFKDNIIVTGVFKIHVDVKTDPRCSQFSSLYDSFDFCQSVNVPTHKRNLILVLVLSYRVPVDHLTTFPKNELFSDTF